MDCRISQPPLAIVESGYQINRPSFVIMEDILVVAYVAFVMEDNQVVACVTFVMEDNQVVNCITFVNLDLHDVQR